MNLTLAEGISFCIVGGRTIILDLPRDRYLCLACEADRLFRGLASGERPDDEDALDELMSCGLLTGSAHGQPVRPCRAQPPEDSLVTNGSTRGFAAMVGALWHLARAEIAVRARPLERNLAALRERKSAVDFEDRPSLETLELIAAAMGSCSLVAPPLDHCLARSIAAAHMMIDRAICPELVIGVRLQPFSAHCWVQHCGILINDTLDRVRNYTPILLV